METLADVAAGHLEQVVLVELLEDGALQLDELERKAEKSKQLGSTICLFVEGLLLVL